MYLKSCLRDLTKQQNFPLTFLSHKDPIRKYVFNEILQ